MAGRATSPRRLTWAIYRETFQKRDYGYGAAIGWMLVIFTIIITTIYFLLLFYGASDGETGRSSARGSLKPAPAMSCSWASSECGCRGAPW